MFAETISRSIRKSSKGFWWKPKKIVHVYLINDEPFKCRILEMETDLESPNIPYPSSRDWRHNFTIKNIKATLDLPRHVIVFWQM